MAEDYIYAVSWNKQHEKGWLLRKKHKLQNKWICVLIFPSNTDCKTSPSTAGVYCHHLEGITENASQIETEWLFSLAELWLTLFQWRTCRVIIPASNHLAGADPPAGWRSKGHQVKVKLNYFFLINGRFMGDKEGCYNQLKVAVALVMSTCMPLAFCSDD